MLRLIQFVTLILGLALVALTSAIVTMRLVIHGAEVKVPNFQGLSAEDAMAKAANLGVEMTIDSRFYSAEVPAGRILSQSPAAGTVVRREWHVRCIESLGPQTVAIPDLIGHPQRSAIIQLRRLGLEVGAIVHLPFAAAAPETVIAQDPPAGAAGVERPSVALALSDSPAQDQADPEIAEAKQANSEKAVFVMPDLIGRPYTVVAAALTRAGLILAPPIETPEVALSGEVAPGFSAPLHSAPFPGSVIAQSPAAGYRVDADTPIQLTVVR